MVLIARIFQILMILFAVRILLRFLYGVAGAARTPGPAPGSGPGAGPKPRKQPGTIEGGHLVRDPNCGTYVAMGRALREGSGDNAVYFCSETCRNAWATRKAG